MAWLGGSRLRVQVSGHCGMKAPIARCEENKRSFEQRLAELSLVMGPDADLGLTGGSLSPQTEGNENKS